jgi:polysaccharide biosynthesis protein PslG
VKRIILTASFLLCCFVCLRASVSFGGENEPDPTGPKNYTKNVFAGNGFITPQTGKSVINTQFGPSDQIGAGINIHFVTGHEKDLDLIAAAGFKFIRMDFEWQETELKKGTYNWEAYDELTSNLKQHGLRAIFILDYSNSLYEEPVKSKDPLTGNEQVDIASPRHPESITAFSQWSAAAAIHFKNSNIIWEIWNEPNISFWKPKPDVSQYIDLALATCKAVKAVVPDAVIIGPTTSEVPLSFLESFLASGVLEYLSAVSVHPYRNYSNSPETAGSDYKKLRELIYRYAPSGKKEIPIISSEWGYSSSTKGVSLETQAELIVRMQLSNLQNGIPVSVWYDWKNDGDDPAEHEQNFGTVSSDLKPKPAYITIKAMNMQLEGFTLLKKIDLKNEKDYALLFKNDKGKYKICAWTVDMSHSAIMDNIVQNVSGSTAIDGKGNIIKLKTEQGKLALDLNALPQYITLPDDFRMN